MRIYMIILMLFLIGAFFIVSQHNLALKDSGNLSQFGKLYLSWLGNVFDNSKNIVADVIKVNWLPSDNLTD